MIVNAPISVGELIDKITILKIKSILIVDTIKLKNMEEAFFPNLRIASAIEPFLVFR